MNKEVRKYIHACLKMMTNKESASKKIFETLASLDMYKKAQTVLCYISLENEVDTAFIIENALKSQKTVGVPVTKDIIKFIKIDKSTVYQRGAFGIKEPISGEEIRDFDLIIVPMVAFDKDCNRLGHGKGYYDRYLADKKSYKIGIAFAEQETNFAVHPHDIPMDMVITQDKIFVT